MASKIELGRSADFIVVAVQPGDTAASLAQKFLNDASQTHRVVPFDTSARAGGELRPGGFAAIALRPVDPGGLLHGEAQRVPILCYHRFTDRSKSTSRMEVTRADFEAQLRYLRDHNYAIIPLNRLREFLDGAAELPAKAVVLTIDDGYRSTYTVAYPLLQKYAAPASLFVYSDFVGSGEALTWSQVTELANSSLIDIQAHSKTHADMSQREHGESDAAYQRRLAQEFDVPRDLLTARAGVHPTAFAYPYGAASPAVLAAAHRTGWKLGLTVLRGGNATWTDPLVLRRDMVFGTDGVEGFARRLASAESAGRRP